MNQDQVWDNIATELDIPGLTGKQAKRQLVKTMSGLLRQHHWLKFARLFLSVWLLAFLVERPHDSDG